MYRGENGDVTESISIKNILLRGCILKNTKAVYGAVISAGIDTKVEFVKERVKWWQVSVFTITLFELENTRQDSYAY